MKKISSLLIAAAVAATTMFSSCNPIDEPASLNEIQFNGDINSFVSQGFNTIGTAGGTLEINTNSPFNVTILNGNGYSVIRNGNQFKVEIGSNADSYTREIKMYIRNFEVNQSVKGFGYFYYPIVVRQQGSKGTRYLNADDLRSLTQKRVNWSNDSYIKGTVKSVSTPYSDSGIKRSTGYYDFPITGHNSLSTDQSKPFDLEAIDLVVESEGVTVTVQAAYVKAYNLISKMNVKVGDTVEIHADKSGVQDASDKDIIVNPLSVVVIK